MRRTTAALWWMAVTIALPGLARTDAKDAAGSSPPAPVAEDARKTTAAQPAEDEEKPTPEQIEAEKKAGPFGNLTFRFIGPPGNRVSAVVGVPGDPNVYYAGAA